MLPLEATSPAPSRVSPGADKTVDAASRQGPKWRSLPAFSGSAACSVTAGPGMMPLKRPVYRSMACVMQPRSASSAFPGNDSLLAALPKQQPSFCPGFISKPSISKLSYTVVGEEQQQQQQQQGSYALTHSVTSSVPRVREEAPLNAPPLPVPLGTYPQSNTSFIIDEADTTSSSLLKHIDNAVTAAGASILKFKEHKCKFKCSVVAPPVSPLGGCADVVFSARVYAVHRVVSSANQSEKLLVEFERLSGPRPTWSKMYTRIYSYLCEQGVTEEGSNKGGTSSSRLYVPLPVPDTVDTNAASLSTPVTPQDSSSSSSSSSLLSPIRSMLSAALSLYVDQQIPACQFIAKLTSTPEIAGTKLHSSSDPDAEAAVADLFASPQVSAFVGLLCSGEVHNTTRRCVMATLANLAISRPDDLKTLLSSHSTLGDAVSLCLPGSSGAGSTPVPNEVFASREAEQALRDVLCA